jgi:hypothetical protein
LACPHDQRHPCCSRLLRTFCPRHALSSSLACLHDQRHPCRSRLLRTSCPRHALRSSLACLQFRWHPCCSRLLHSCSGFLGSCDCRWLCWCYHSWF